MKWANSTCLQQAGTKHREFVAVCQTCAPQACLTARQAHLVDYGWVGNGCPPKDRLALCKAFIAKAVWDFPTTRDLIDAVRHRPTLRRLCGWERLGEIPSEATFSRAFAAFARDALPQRIHEAMIQAHYGDKLAGHVSRDGTAVKGREKAAPKEPPAAKDAKKRGRRLSDLPAAGRRQAGNGEESPPPEPTRLEQQLERSLEANLDDLPTACNWGCKKNSQGKVEYWRGYKLHLDVIDGDLPVSWLVSSACLARRRQASLHDSQACLLQTGRHPVGPDDGGPRDQPLRPG